MFRLPIFAALGAAYALWRARRGRMGRAQDDLAGRRFRIERRKVEGVEPRPAREHGLALPAPLTLSKLEIIDAAPAIEDAVEIGMVVDRPDEAAHEYVYIDTQAGKVLRRTRGAERQAPSLALWRQDALVLCDASDVVADGPLRLLVDYPLGRPVAATLPAQRHTRLELLCRICETYEHIYAEEARSTKVAVGKQGDTLNRNATDGAFAISMHDLSDLVIERVLIGTHGGERWVTLEMGS